VDSLSLSDEARTSAVKVRRDLEDAEQAAKARVDEAEMVWRAHRAAAPLDLADDGLVLTPELFAALERRAAEALQLADTAVRAEAALEQEFAADREARGGVEERVRNLELAEADLAQWEIVHELIGMGEGERFAKVVQALNLQKVLDRANANLQRFMPRYALVQVTHPTEGPKLDFRVTDREHQDAARTIKSLSGGESFVVSLALALGLAATRSSSLRIETLLIDEGFGALDARTLETATAALTALQGALGVRIGLISHVEYLKEAIPAQFVVETLGGGRSRVVASP
jgi:exonuclease SbcC